VKRELGGETIYKSVAWFKDSFQCCYKCKMDLNESVVNIRDGAFELGFLTSCEVRKGQFVRGGMTSMTMFQE